MEKKTISITKETLEMLEIIAKRKTMTVKNLIQTALDEWILDYLSQNNKKYIFIDSTKPA